MLRTRGVTLRVESHRRRQAYRARADGRTPVADVLNGNPLAVELELFHPPRLCGLARFPIRDLAREPLRVRFENMMLSFANEMRRARILTKGFDKLRRVRSA